MNDACGVCSDEALEDVFDDRPDFGERQVLFALEAIGETFTFELFEDEQMSTVGGHADFEQAAHVRALNGRSDLCFSLETTNEVRFDGRSRKQDFDGNLAAIRIAARSPNLPHAAAAEEAGYSVAR
jgi:hypothetical protein